MRAGYSDCRSYQQRKRLLRCPTAFIGACESGTDECCAERTAPASEEHTLQRAGTRSKRLRTVGSGRGDANARMLMFPCIGSLLPHKDRRTSRDPAPNFQGSYKGAALRWVQTRKTLARSSVTHSILPAISISRQTNNLSCVSSMCLQHSCYCPGLYSPFFQRVLTEGYIILFTIISC